MDDMCQVDTISDDNEAGILPEPQAWTPVDGIACFAAASSHNLCKENTKVYKKKILPGDFNCELHLLRSPRDLDEPAQDLIAADSEAISRPVAGHDEFDAFTEANNLPHPAHYDVNPADNEHNITYHKVLRLFIGDFCQVTLQDSGVKLIVPDADCYPSLPLNAVFQCRSLCKKTGFHFGRYSHRIDSLLNCLTGGLSNKLPWILYTGKLIITTF
jgi:hypothetical protein